MGIKRKMKLLFQLAMTFLALVCLATAIPAPKAKICSGNIWECPCCGQRLEESVVEPKKEQNSAELKRALNLLRMAIPVPRPTNRNGRGKEFWGCQVLGSSRFGVVKIRGRRVLGSSSFGIVEF